MIDHVGTVRFRIQDVDLSECENDMISERPNKMVYYIVFKVIIRLGTEEGTLHVSVMWKDKLCGSDTFKFAHEDV